MKIEGHQTPSSHRPAPHIAAPPTDRAGDRSRDDGTGDPAFVIDLGPQARRSFATEIESAPEAPGKSADSPAHRARALIAQFLALNETEESPFKAFGQIVSQLAQGKSFDEIFPPATADDDAPSVQTSPDGAGLEDEPATN